MNQNSQNQSSSNSIKSGLPLPKCIRVIAQNIEDKIESKVESIKNPSKKDVLKTGEEKESLEKEIKPEELSPAALAAMCGR
jgi:hypothetical protein